MPELLQAEAEELRRQSCSQQQAAALCGAWGVVTWCELTDGTMGNRAKTLFMQPAEASSYLSDQPEDHTYPIYYHTVISGHSWDVL